LSLKISDNANDLAFEPKATTERLTRALAEATPETIFQKAIVMEVIADPAAFKGQAEFADKYKKDAIENHQYINRVPRNAIIARVLNDGQGKRTQTSTICLPFFPPHFCFPIKPGEHVWVISPAPIGEAAKISYWLCRVPGWDDTDDVNYTHNDREHHSTFNTGDASTSDQHEQTKPKTENKDDIEMFGFPNGTADPDGFTFGSEPDGYTTVVTDSLAYKSFKPEPVPRLTKRPGDLVLQGSNNTSITLGTTRGLPGGWLEEGLSGDEEARFADYVEKHSTSTLVNAPDATAPDLAKIAAAIDIVVGRGLRIRTDGLTHFEADEDPPLLDMSKKHPPTYPRVKATLDPESARGHASETSKNPLGYVEDVTDNQKDHPFEGDPDFRYDAARIYVNSDSSPDIDFGFVPKPAPDADPEKFKLSDSNEVDVQAGSTIVLKSDQVRIIARRDPEDLSAANPVVNGSIRLIREGKVSPATGAADPADRAVISIEPDGTIYIDGPKIVIGGRLKGANGEGDQVFIGTDATESLVMGEFLETALNAFANDIAGSFGAGSASSGNLGGPVLAPMLATAASNLATALVLTKSKLAKTK